jgi:ABC-type multidrug transport system ATPase subunit
MDIHVKINQEYKSIGVCEFALPKFCVLTGKNGSGKTHLLDAIAMGQLQNRSHTLPVVAIGERRAICHNIKKIPFGQLNPNIVEKCDPVEINKFVKEAYNCLSNRSSVSSQNRTQIDEFIKYVSTQRDLPDFRSITEEDLRQYFDVKFMGNDDMLSGKFALIFKNYARIRDINLTNRLKSENGYPTIISADLLSDDEFVGKYGIPPWDLVNGIFKRVNIPYSANNPEREDRDSSFNLELFDREKDNIRIKCSDLSTGEKVLMSLAMAIYNSDTNCKKPDLLLIDEPDAGLHPSMSKDMVDVLREFVVEKLGIPVIITTHSPTTIAAMEGVEIYEKERGVDIPKKISKEDALTLLTADIPFLTVSVEKRRAVFVESQYDVDIYSALYEIFKDKIAVEPHFFQFYKNKSVGSNCEDVIRTAQNLKDCGDTQVYGIADYDNTANRVTKDNLLVLGNGERYAIENFILDPLLVGLFLVATRKMNFSDFGITRLSTYMDMKELNIEEAQLIIDFVLNRLGFSSEPKIVSALCNGWETQIAQSIAAMQGHNLEASCKTSFPCLNAYNDDAVKTKNLKLQIVDAVVKSCPGFLPKSILDTLLAIK